MIFRVLIAALGLLTAAPGLAELAPKASSPGMRDYVRIVNDDAGAPLSMQVSIARFADPEASVRVDLISAVHMADAGFYEVLNERFRDYDSVLYELVAPQGTRVSRDTEPEGWLSNAQVGMTRALGLTFQLQQIDYLADNLVHADLSPKELGQAMRERGETPGVFAWRIFAASMREAGSAYAMRNSMTMLADLFPPPGIDGRRLMFAREMARTMSLEEVLGDDAESSIVGARNERAIDVLQQQLAAGDQRVGIFYGAAHMPDFERRLVDELGMQREGVEWLDAWSLRE